MNGTGGLPPVPFGMLDPVTPRQEGTAVDALAVGPVTAVGALGADPCRATARTPGSSPPAEKRHRERDRSAMSSGCPAGLPDVEATPSIVLVVTGRVTRAAVPALCAELESLLYDAEGVIRDPGAGVDCDVGGVIQADLALVEAVVRLGLVARRAGGRQLRLRRAPPELQALLDLVGLGDVVTPGERS
ncbi:STAS domain-containing protein [Streptomyces sp. NPDC005262]|uniref:STAS domain-containing protein n=1 Tax=Streptomyces sp. NPDC005262 TaxID=3364710 RepID=UPI0036BC5322